MIMNPELEVILALVLCSFPVNSALLASYSRLPVTTLWEFWDTRLGGKHRAQALGVKMYVLPWHRGIVKPPEARFNCRDLPAVGRIFQVSGKTQRPALNRFSAVAALREGRRSPPPL